MISHEQAALRGAASFGGAAAILLAGTLTFFAMRQAAANREAVVHTNAVIEQTTATLSAIQDAETGQRGFLLTGDTSYLTPYHSALRAVASDTTALRSLTRDNLAQQRRLESLSPLVNAKLAELARTIELQRAGRRAEADAIVRTNRGQLLMDTVRLVLGAVASQERQLLQERGDAANRSARIALLVLIIGTFAALGSALFVNGMLSRFATEQARAAEILRDQNEVVNAANAAKSDFLAAVSHELRTPLNAIDGYTELLLLGIRGELSGEQRADIQRIKKSSRHLLTLINQVLNLAKVESGQMDLQPSIVSCPSLLQDAADLIQPQMAAKQIAFKVESCDPDTLVYADADRTKQILLNLLTNAQKFTDTGGQVVLHCEPAGPRMLCMHVADTGRGIPLDKQAGIFEPFTQLNRLQTPDAQRGIGLGLSISRTLARAMGGDLTVESAVGKGSVFRLTLPTAPPEP